MRQALLGILCLSMLALAACGDESAPEEERTTPYGTASGGTTTPDGETPQAIGEAVAGLYVDTMKKVTAALESRPEAEAAKAQLEDIKAQAVAALVALGRRRAALDAAGQATVNQKVQAGISRLPSDVFKAFSAAHKHYMAADRETGNLISSFNVITQYADFELLKKQLPKEYERLGLGD